MIFLCLINFFINFNYFIDELNRDKSAFYHFETKFFNIFEISQLIDMCINIL